jgi:putative alpha-1,2-mannosidase
MNRLLILALLALAFFPKNATGQIPAANYIRYVNPFIGTGGHGHTYPGATAPFGLVQLSPDTRIDMMDWDGCSGYHYSDSLLYGFSHTHLSGTGVADYCDILFMPYTGERGPETRRLCLEI